MQGTRCLIHILFDSIFDCHKRSFSLCSPSKHMKLERKKRLSILFLFISKWRKKRYMKTNYQKKNLNYLKLTLSKNIRHLQKYKSIYACVRGCNVHISLSFKLYYVFDLVLNISMCTFNLFDACAIHSHTVTVLILRLVDCM